MKSPSNQSIEEILPLIEVLINELIKIDKKYYENVLEKYQKDMKYRFLEDPKWMEFIKSNIEINSHNSNEIYPNPLNKLDTDFQPSTQGTSDFYNFLTPENLPAGVIATIVQIQIKNNKELKQPYVPYQMLEMKNIPNINMNEVPSTRSLRKLEEFYKFYKPGA